MTHKGHMPPPSKKAKLQPTIHLGTHLAKKDADLSKDQMKRLKVQKWIQRNSKTKCRMMDQFGPHYEYIVNNLQWANKIWKNFGPPRQERCGAKHDADKDVE